MSGQAKRYRLDRFLSEKTGIKRGDFRQLIAQKRVLVDYQPATSPAQQIDYFSHVQFDDHALQQRQPIYLMLNKPAGIVSATSDAQHKTVLDLIDHPGKDELHIVGRLDRFSTGLLLLTNDSQWSQQLMQPEQYVAKHYQVTLEKPLDNRYIDAFATGFDFDYEGITTRPAKLEIISTNTADVVLHEGRYHQIKRMFGRFRNPVIALHRYAVGNLKLCSTLTAGEYRHLTAEEIHTIATTDEK